MLIIWGVDPCAAKMAQSKCHREKWGTSMFAEDLKICMKQTLIEAGEQSRAN